MLEEVIDKAYRIFGGTWFTYIMGLRANLRLELIIHFLQLIESLRSFEVVIQEFLGECGRLEGCMPNKG